MSKRFCWLLLLIGWSVSVQAGNVFERLLSPGDLTRAHQKQDKDCESCHADFENQEQRGLCLDCHDKISKDLLGKQGFHGKQPGVANSECRICHSEHQGRDADIVQFNPHGFNHLLTDFPLKGRHLDTACVQCHVEDKPFRDAPGQCVDCHKEDDVHQGKQGKACDSCHATENWRDAKFDHDKTSFPLQGAHQQVVCNQCHRSPDFKQTPDQCASCHKIDDVHLNQFGPKCESCHTTQKWSQTDFNHQRDTDFKLEGAHQSLSCPTCHKSGTVAANLPDTCHGCHQHDDVHFGKNGQDCAQCHTVQRWRDSRFNHDKTDFVLRGAHTDVACERCHHNDVHKPIPSTQCTQCHQQNDVHKGALSAPCESCHNETGWQHQIRFDHDLTAFPLLGGHATVACESCHPDFTFVGQGAQCVSCHKQDDVHKGAMGAECSTCHHPVGWGVWRFDHDRQTEFSLQGAHKGLSCEACHSAENSLEQLEQGGGQCGLCHQADDVHRGAYGMACDNCHDTSNFSTLHMR